ncbi:MAG: DNA polymerase, partial [Armatimonadia bacterium]
GGSGALAFMQSLFTWRPYHKHLLKEAQSLEEKAHYCMLDCVVTWEGFMRMRERCQQEQPQSWEAYLRDAVPLLPIMVSMTETGINMDAMRFEKKRKTLRQTADAQADALIAVYGEGIRPKGKHAKTKVSVAGLKTVLQARGIKLPTARKDGEARPTLDREARQKLIVKYPELADLDAYWETQDRLSDCYKPIMDRDGRCRPDWSGYLTSWRWRVTHPNIAQWPESEREVFCASPGRVLVQFDTSAGEYRWFAAESGDRGLLQKFADYDASGDSRLHPHVANTSVLFGVEPATAAAWKDSGDPKEKARYTFSKNYIYRLMYSYRGGIDELRATAAKAGLKFSRKDIEAFDKVWFATYPVAAEWRERQVRQVLRSRVVMNREWGYTRRLHGQDEDKLANIALNFVMQSGIAGIVNKTVIETWETCRLAPLVNMHDGLIYDVPEGQLAAVIEYIRSVVEAPLPTLQGAVIPVDIKIGERWGKSMRGWKA